MTVSRRAKAAQYTTHQETGGKCYRFDVNSHEKNVHNKQRT